ncbi:MAG: TetR/AcrR family transcriptional regulator [Saprospiraceae bacterium]|nr:TetR/AcrR family transcriptional regulator [Saprospiraceae bacterium]MCC6414232.1 TetR/AcrR family transcriptional regulator [Saprospiraceae bacterium]
MQFQIRIQAGERLALRDPEDTTLGRNIVRQGLVLMHQLGFEHFTFKKLAEAINTTEASIYRYFENKHRLLLYILTWYWNYLEYLVVFTLQNLQDPEQKIKKVIELLVNELPDEMDQSGLDKQALYHIVIAESSKVYLTREVEEINKNQLFKPYKDLCARIATLFQEYNPAYPYPHSLASTVVETAHFQYFFMKHLPRLTDFNTDPKVSNIEAFLENLVFSAIRK